VCLRRWRVKPLALFTLSLMKHQIVQAAILFGVGGFSFAGHSQSQIPAAPSHEKLRVGAMELARGVATAGTSNDLAALAEVMPTWSAFESAFDESLGRQAAEEVVQIREAWKSEEFCDEWVRSYRRSCAQDDLEFMYLKPVEVIYVKCGKELDDGVPDHVCYTNVRIVDGKGKEGIMRMLAIVDRGQLWLADEVEIR